MLDDAGFPDAEICASSDLDEYLIDSLLSQGACIDSWGVGTNLITSKNTPAFGGVYKLAAVEIDGEMIPKIKLSENPAKITNPGDKTVYRIYDKESGKIRADYITLADETFDESEDLLLFDPNATWKKTRLEGGTYTMKEILVPIFKNGQCVYDSPSVMEIQKHCKEQLETMWEESRRLVNPQEVFVDLADKLYEMKKELLKELDFKEYQLVSFLNNQGVFREKYILVEDDEKDGILIGEVTGKKARKYYATRDGRFYIKWASGCITELYPFPKKRGNETIAVIRFNRKERYAKNLIASLFIKEMNKSDFVILKDGNWENISVENLEIISQKEYRSISRKKEQKKVGKFINNQLFKKYSSAWDASKDLCISYQTVIDYCYNTVKDPKQDLRWI